jgi:general secretion pathway protein A
MLSLKEKVKFPLQWQVGRIMFKTFYSLASTPFPKDIKTQDIFHSSSQKEVAARLDYLKKAHGIGLITGEPGVGKTLALRVFADSLNPALFKPMYLPLSTLTVMDVYRAIATALGENPKAKKIDLFLQIQSTIVNLSKNRGIIPVLILDEMHLARDSFFADISLLFNFNMDSETPFILILSGISYLNTKLSLNQNKPLNQRISTRYNFEPFSPAETAQYISKQLSFAGANYEIFSESAVLAVHSLSSGFPRVINQLCIHSLIYGFQCKKQVIDEECVRDAAIEAGL